MDSTAKKIINCDSCKTAIQAPVKKAGAKEAPVDPSLMATLSDHLANTKDFHFCDEECLRVFLNSRRKKAKASLELDIVNNTSAWIIKEM